jgi:glycosyltransferase involved in cell wall biosynthesis
VKRFVDDVAAPVMSAPEAIDSYEHLLANSQFTADWTFQRWKRSAEVLYPAVRFDVDSNLEKQKNIVMLGRFVDPRLGHCKRQLEAVEAFRSLCNNGHPGWRLQLLGGVARDGQRYLQKVRTAAEGLPVDIFPDANENMRMEALRNAAIVWQLTGIGLDPTSEPEKFEHFGIALVEGMSFGAIPIVLGQAGPAEIVRHTIDGFHITTIETLVQRTKAVMGLSEQARVVMAGAAQSRATHFGSQQFSERLHTLVNLLA